MTWLAPKTVPSQVNLLVTYLTFLGRRSCETTYISGGIKRLCPFFGMTL